jgi:arylsulfatase
MKRILILLALLSSFTAASHAAAPPNILLIMVDDMGYSDLGSGYGGEVRTASSDCPGGQTSCLSRSVCNR